MNRLAAGAAAVAALGGAGAAALLRSGLPKTRGEVRVRGIDGPISIDRDAEGIPHIRATSDRDAFFAQGWCLAQDRMWQLDSFRRLCFGTISEVAGPAGLESDRFMRRLGLRRIAEAAYATMGESSRAALHAYADGINACLESFPRRLPFEHLLTRARPAPWEPLASIAFVRYMGWNLGGAHERMLAVGRCALLLPADLFGRWFGDGADGMPPHALHPEAELEVLRQAQAAQATAARTTGLGAAGIGSNAWAVAGTKTRSGKPLLASDPHLVIAMPSLWYELSIDSPGYQATGACLPAVPGVVIGRGPTSAWGITATMLIASDLYVEEIHPDDPHLYRVGDAWRPLDEERQTIAVKGRAPEELVVRRTRHGPVIFDAKPGDNTAIALRWAGAEPGDDLVALLGGGRAQSWQELREALRSLVAPSVNCVYADAGGTIGYQLAGRYPARTGGGLAPIEGWHTGDEDGEWKGFIPFDALPTATNPPSGFIASANTRMVGPDYPYEIRGMWEPPHRLGRIAELLEGRSSLTLDDMRSMQADVRSPRAVQLLPTLVSALVGSGSPDLTWASAQLSAWEGDLSTDSVAATLFEVWFSRCLDLCLGARLTPEQSAAVLAATKPGWGDGVFAWLEREIARPGGDWLGDAERHRIFRQAMLDGIAWLRARLGTRREDWTWGRLHTITFRHPLGIIPGLSRVLNRGPYPMDGGTVTLSSAVYSSGAYEVGIASSYRQIVDLAEPERSLSSTTSGQSGHPAARHYADQCLPWLRHGYHPLGLDAEEVTRRSVAHLRLEPMR